MDPNYLSTVFQGCFNLQTVKRSQQQLDKLKNQQDFLEACLRLIPNQKHDMLMIILSTIKNYLIQRYNSPEFRIPQQQKQIIKDNALNFYYSLNQNPKAIQMYHEIMKALLKAQSENWTGSDELLVSDLKGQILASVHFIYSVSQVYEYQLNEKREPFEVFMEKYFPYLEEFTKSCLVAYDKQRADLLVIILETLYCSLHSTVSRYFRNFQVLSNWILYFNTIMKADINIQPQNQKLVIKIYRVLCKLYANDNNEGKQFKGWANEFRCRFSENIYKQLICYFGTGDEQCQSNILQSFCSIIQNSKTINLMSQQHCNIIVYKGIMPGIQRAKEEESLFFQQPLQYIRRDQDSNAYMYRKAAVDLLKAIMNNLSFNGKLQLIKFMEYSGQVLGSTDSNEKQKQSILRVYYQLYNLFLRNHFIKQKIQPLTQAYFINILKGDKPILIYHVYKVLQKFIDPEKISPNLSQQLAQLTYGHILQNNTVIKFSAMLFFTKLLQSEQAFNTAKPHFKSILEIYVKMLDTFDHESLYQCLESIAQTFQSQIPPVAVDLICHLINLFYTQAKKVDQQEDDEDDQQNNSTATATLQTIKQIIQAPLTDQQYWQIGQKILILTYDMLTMVDEYSRQILEVLNVFIYKSKGINEFEFPYLLCRKLLNGDNSLLQKSTLANDVLQKLSQTAKADDQYSEILISIIKNLVQKMPDDVLHRFPYPSDSEILMCLIQNKRLSPNEVRDLPKNLIDKDWLPYIDSYIAYLYNIGNMHCPSRFKVITGLSLAPWIDSYFGSATIKKVIVSLASDEEDDYEENTMMMLEKCAAEDDESQDQDFFGNSGINYSYLYKSPFDSQKDLRMMMDKLRNLPQNEANKIRTELSDKYKKKLDTVIMNSSF